MLSFRGWTEVAPWNAAMNSFIGTVVRLVDPDDRVYCYCSAYDGSGWYFPRQSLVSLYYYSIITGSNPLTKVYSMAEVVRMPMGLYSWYMSLRYPNRPPTPHLPILIIIYPTKHKT